MPLKADIAPIATEAGYGRDSEVGATWTYFRSILRADVIALVAQVSSGPEADDETERLGIPKADDKPELLR